MKGNKHPLQILLENYNFPVQPYSGRGMYGKICLGVIVPRGREGNLLSKIIFGVAARAMAKNQNINDITDVMKSYTTDSMGKSDMIVYWPDVPFTA